MSEFDVNVFVSILSLLFISTFTVVRDSGSSFVVQFRQVLLFWGKICCGGVM